MKTATRALVAALSLLAAPALGLVAPAHATEQASPNPSPTAILVGHVVDGPTPVSGDPLHISGSLVSGGEPVAGRTVLLRVRPAGAEDFRTVARATTDDDGGFDATYEPRTSFVYRLRFAGDESYFPSRTNPWAVAVGPRVSIGVRPELVTLGDRIVVTGDTTPHRAGRVVELYVGTTNRGGYGPDTHARLLADGVVADDGTYRLTTFPDWINKTRRIFVQVAGGGRNATGWSPYRRIYVGGLPD